MAGTVTQTSSGVGIELLAFDWLSHTDGTVSATSSTGKYTGLILAVEFVPDGGATAPDDGYDVTLTDSNSIDLLCGQGANLSNVNTIVVNSGLLPIVFDTISITVSGAGSANAGIVYIWLDRS
jgi:hypothetical protein